MIPPKIIPGHRWQSIEELLSIFDKFQNLMLQPYLLSIDPS